MSELPCIQGHRHKGRAKLGPRKGIVPRREDSPKRPSVWICGQISSGRNWKYQEKQEITSEGSSERIREKNELWGGNDPALSGLAAAQGLRRKGATAQLVDQTFLAPSLANRKKAVTESEQQTTGDQNYGSHSES
jgi:hypothetical protein